MESGFLISVLFAKAMQWGIPQLVLAVLAVIAAWRWKLAGIWILAAAAIVALLTKVAMAVVIGRHNGLGPDLMRLFAYPNMLALLISIVGWGFLAFGRTKTFEHDA